MSSYDWNEAKQLFGAPAAAQMVKTAFDAFRNVRPYRMFNRRGRGVFAGTKRRRGPDPPPAGPGSSYFTRRRSKAKLQNRAGRVYTRLKRRRRRRRKRMPHRFRRYVRKAAKYHAKRFAPWTIDNRSDAHVMVSGINEKLVDEILLVGRSNVEGMLGNIKQLGQNVTHTGTEMISNNLGSVTNTQLQFKGFVWHYHRNNCEIPQEVVLKHVICTSDTADTPKTAITESYSDFGISNGLTDVNYPMLPPKHCQTYHKFWRTVKSWNFVLQPGGEIKIPIALKSFVYNPDRYDNNPNNHLKGVDQLLLIQIRGTIAHGVTTSTEVGFAETRMDCVDQYKYKYKPIGGNFIPYGYSTVSALGSLTSGGNEPEIVQQQDPTSTGTFNED